MKLVAHAIWGAFEGINTFEDFQTKVLRPIYFKPEVPKDILAFANNVEKLLLHSYYEYEFIDIALTHAIFTFEKAMRIR